MEWEYMQGSGSCREGAWCSGQGVQQGRVGWEVRCGKQS